MSVVSNASRRAVLTGLAGTVAGCAVTPATPVTGFAPRRIAPILMAPERIIRITVCTRPFRATGPRLDVESVGETKVVHNYGHGGSGWSLSWGSSAIAGRKAMALAGLAGGPPVIAVIGSGALGLTSALQLQRMGARVTIYARERAAFTRSMRATGSWTPDSRIADADRVSAEFPALWEQMARETYATHQTYLGTEGDPVVFSDRYMLSGGADLPRSLEPPPIRTGPGVKPIRFAEYRLDGLAPRSFPLPASASPFPVGETRMVSAMQFNVAELAHRLETEFLAHGGRIETRTFNTPADMMTLPEKVVVNCTGYGAKALFEDKELIPVRGQIAWLAPQPEANYGLHFRGVTVLSRPDGIVVQATRNDMNGVGIDDETPDRGEANATIGLVAPLFPPIRRLPSG
ncbi:D-amino-acid oxidase [Brevundimonas intermedia]|uniref:D-amino-acid oxidase n=1 Tax=Brevundimonas intermedia TaxID=74315 RepID=A0ABQ5TCC5_9CAUL|nr:FAD-dependent oxidoreductase [Brevundimonas intermedia]GLK50018.1 D-amino-acid oxidase [Brevundimonas intermedia]